MSGRPSNETNQCLPAVWRPTSWPGPVRPVKSSPHGPPAFCRPVFYILCPQVMGCYQVSGFVAWPPGLFLLRWLNRSSLPRTILVKLGEVVTLFPEAWTPHAVPVVTSAHIEPVPCCFLRRSPGYTPPGLMGPPACPLWLLHFSSVALITTASNITSCGISFLIFKACTSLTGG